MKKVFTSKSFLTVMSILSILFFFVLLCGASMFLLERMGFVSFSGKNQEVTVSAGTESDDEEEFPLHLEVSKTADGVGMDGGVPKELIEQMPFVNQYYMKLSVHSDISDGPFAQGIYEIWRLDEKYRIHRYDISNQEVELVMICDGKRVQIQDYEEASITNAAYDAEYAFSEVAPIPNFRKLFSDIFVFSSYQEEQTTAWFSCVYPVLGVEDFVEFSKSTGLVTQYRRFHGDSILLSVRLVELHENYTFMDYIFYFD